MVAKDSADVADVSDFFPNASDDLSEISWGHAVNSKDLLEKSIKDDGINMLEADVLSGNLEGESSSDPQCAIMAHPPATTSDISLEMWIRRVIDANQNGKKKGAKLDFKDEDILEASLEILKSRSDEITFPLLLNADILKGPHDSPAKAITADKFLKLCSENFPKATLSVGWTTATKDVSDEFAVYTKAMVEEMKEALERNSIVQPVTFPIRAAFLGASLENLEWLIENVPDSSITVWSSSDDTIDVTTLMSLREKIGLDALFVDLPEEQQKEFEVAKSVEANASEPTYAFFPPATSLYATAAVGVASLLLTLYYYD